jgi:hypothetical protein
MGARNRYKVRSREYEDTHLTFFEVKHKTSKRRTIKHRLPTQDLITAPYGDASEFLDQVSPFGMQDLVPRSWNRYRRITLVANDTPERVTLDIDLEFYWQNRWAGLPGIVIAEVKQPPHGGHSPFVKFMRSRRFRSSGFSKYCMGVTMLYPDVKQNRFKPVQRRVARLMEEQNHGYY